MSTRRPLTTLKPPSRRTIRRVTTANNPGLRGVGYLVAFGDKWCGWTLSLAAMTGTAAPRPWRPGCVAMPCDGRAEVWEAVGGNYQDGAERWELRT